MPTGPLWNEEESFELTDRQSRSDNENPLYAPDLDDDDDDGDGRIDAHLLGTNANAQSAYPETLSGVKRIWNLLQFTTRRRRQTSSRRRPRHNSVFCLRLLLFLVGVVSVVFVASAVLFPPYTTPPAHYTDLRRRIGGVDGFVPGAGNPRHEKVFIAASIFDRDGTLTGGKWGECVLNLIHILGSENTYLSIYENDAGEIAKEALQGLKQKVTCENTLRYDEHLGFDEVDHIKLPDGSDRVKRITYLSEARNRALLPLESATVHYDKLLYLNDVVFDPVEAAQLLFLTGVEQSPDAQSSYRAACAVDFINPIKYYDTFATRDYEGYGIGLPFFPWYTTAGTAVSRGDVMAGSDAVRVRSCWGGMVAFDAQFFQPQVTNVPETAASKSPLNTSAPYRFRAEPDLFWDASECCLIQADIQDPDTTHSGIYMNPYVRTAYDWNTLRWLTFMRRFEKLLTPVHWILTKGVGMPWYNPRRAEHPWDEVEEQVWNSELASFEYVKRIAGHSGFCGRPGLQVMKIDASKGEKPYEIIPAPG